MTVAAALLSLMASASAAGQPVPAGPVPGAVAPRIAANPHFLAAEFAASLDLASLQDPQATEAPAFGGQPLTNQPLPAEEPREQPTPPSQENQVDGRRRPDIRTPLPEPVDQYNPGAIRQPEPEAFSVDHIGIPDRWRLIDTLGIVRNRWYDPYNQNTLKGDRPVCLPTDEEQERRRAAGIPRCATPRILGLTSNEWFFTAGAISDTVFEPRSFPIPGGVQTTGNTDQNDVFGRNNSIVAAQTFIFSAALIKGFTTFRPPDIEWRATVAVQANYVDVSERRVLDVRPTQGSNRFDYAVGIQELSFLYDFGPTSSRFDFYALRVGIQEFQFDFRGFLFQDNQLGIRLFANRDNNRWQFNLQAVWRLEKDTNSGLNNLFQTPRDDWVLNVNAFRQDFPFVGLTSQLSLTWNINRERNEIEVDDNGFPVRPALFGRLRSRDYDAFYLGYSVDGHIGRLNLSGSAYALFGSDRQNTFTGRNARIQAFFAAIEPSVDFDWIRLRGAALYASGDGDPFDNVQHGFDSIFQNPIFAGADTSYWLRQAVPFAGGARAVNFTNRNSVLIDLRSSKEQGQSNFVNPGTMLLGVGADFDLTTQWRLSTNINHIWMQNTAVVRALRQQGTVRRDIGWDLSAALIWRPLSIQNVVFRLSGALLQPGTGFRDLFTDEQRDRRSYSVLFNAIVTY